VSDYDDQQQVSSSRLSLVSLLVTVGILAWAIVNAYLAG
jgi:hypothetical protein